jgi:hypothetical protein
LHCNFKFALNRPDRQANLILRLKTKKISPVIRNGGAEPLKRTRATDSINRHAAPKPSSEAGLRACFDELKPSHLSAVAPTKPNSRQAGVSARSISVLWSQLMDENVDHRRIRQRGECHPTGVYRSTSGYRHQALNMTLDFLRLCLSRGDGLMHHKRSHHVANESEAPIRRQTKAPALLLVLHRMLLPERETQ